MIIDSYAMRELPALIDALGPEQFVELLESRAVRIRADGWVLAEIGNDARALRRISPLPPLSFALAPLVPAQEYRRDHISRSLADVRAMALGKKTSQQVRQAIVDSLTPFPAHPGAMTMDQLPGDLTMRLDLVRAATDWAIGSTGSETLTASTISFNSTTRARTSSVRRRTSESSSHSVRLRSI